MIQFIVVSSFFLQDYISFIFLLVFFFVVFSFGVVVVLIFGEDNKGWRRLETETDNKYKSDTKYNLNAVLDREFTLRIRKEIIFSSFSCSKLLWVSFIFSFFYWIQDLESTILSMSAHLMEAVILWADDIDSALFLSSLHQRLSRNLYPGHVFKLIGQVIYIYDRDSETERINKEKWSGSWRCSQFYQFQAYLAWR